MNSTRGDRTAPDNPKERLCAGAKRKDSPIGHLSLDLPNSIRRYLHELAAAEGVSVEQFVASAIAEKVAALLAEDYLRRHAAGASPAAMQAVLDKIPFRPPLLGDE